MKKLLLTTALVAFASTAHAAGNTASDTAEATATVVKAIAITNVVDATFGSFTVGSTAGTITTAGVVDGGVTRVPADNPTHGFALTVEGEDGYEYDVKVGNTIVTTPNMPNITMTLTNTTGNNETMTATLTDFAGYDSLSNGSDDLTGEATLAVDPNQASGVYSGTVNLTAVYQ